MNATYMMMLGFLSLFIALLIVGYCWFLSNLMIDEKDPPRANDELEDRQTQYDLSNIGIEL